MSPTFFYGILTFILVLGPLVILHELGHFLVARRFGVKVVEFGFGFPPKAGGIWTGRTEIRLDGFTRFNFPEGRDGIRTGHTVSIATVPGPDGVLLARTISPMGDGKAEAGRAKAGQAISGKLRDVNSDRLAVSEMLWSFNWLPLGGFVRMVGEEDPNAPGALASKPRWQRISVMAAGAGVNLIIPFILFPLILLIPQQVNAGEVILTNVLPGSPAERAGLEPGDKVVKVDGREIEHVSDLQQAVTLKLGATSTWEVRKGIPDPFPQPGAEKYQYPGPPVAVQVAPRWKPPRREVVEEVQDASLQVTLQQARLYDLAVGLSTQLRIVEVASDTLHEISLEDARRISPLTRLGDTLTVVGEVGDARSEISVADARKHDSRLGLYTYLQEGAVGVTIGAVNVKRVTRSLPPWEAVPEGLRGAYDVIVLTRNGVLGLLIGSKNPAFSGPSTVGPIGIGQLTGEVAAAKDVGIGAKIATLANLAGALSFSLAVLNILPIPALDGGRVLFVVIEWVRRGKRISPQREGLVHLVGFVILLSLIALVSVRDILRIVRGDSFF
jgi:regulator of sigma E protease